MLETNLVGCSITTEVEVDDEDLEDLDENEQERIIDDYVYSALFDSGLISWGWEKVE